MIIPPQHRTTSAGSDHGYPLRAILDSPLQKSRIISLAAVASQDFPMHQLLDLCFDSSSHIAFRASWILEQVYFSEPSRFEPVVQFFLARFPDQENASARRHFTKILGDLTKSPGRAAVTAPIPSAVRKRLIETLFDWLIEPETPVAIKSNCLSVLANFGSEDSWIREELQQVIAALEGTESISFFARAKQVKKRLRGK